MRKDLISKSKLLSLVLRHDPGAIGIALDAHGWANLDELLGKAAANGKRISEEELLEVVETNEKKRFELDLVKRRIRASQGHSIQVDVELPVATPPDELFHGTAEGNVESIMQQGLNSGARQHVHLSTDVATARAVGTRHGSPVILHVDSKTMAQDGNVFYLSKNGVWLTQTVPAKYLKRT